jgi:type I restriction enzyme S subunit
MLLSNLNLLATAPGGVARLRELILTLAVQGKLVPQVPKDEPASELLKKIRAEKDRLVADKSIRRLKPLDPIDKSECGFALPSNWVWERLGNLGDWGAGATPSRSNSNYYGGDIPWFKSGELTADFISESEETVTEAALRDCSLRLNQVGDVLIAMYGATIGKTAILSVVATTNQAVCACTPFAGLSNTYLLLLMKALKPYFISIGAGGAQPNISREKVIATVIGLPPLAEQSRIVTRVEELMRLCDALEAKGQLEATQHAQLVSTLLGTLTESETPEELAYNWQRVATHFDLLLDRPEAVDALEQTILQLAVRGLLVPQDPQDEPASELLEQIRAGKDRLIAEGKIKRDKPMPQIAEDEQPFALPAGWEWVRLGSLISLVTSGSRSWKDFYATEGATFIRSQDIKFDRLKFDERAYVKLPPGAEGSRTQIFLNDLLITITGANVGKAAVVMLPIPEAYVSQHVALVRLLDVSMVDYLHLWLVGEHGGRRLVLMSSYGAKPGLNLQNIIDLLVPVPPLAEQCRIVARVAGLRSLCADLRQRLAAASERQSQIAQSLVEMQSTTTA